MNEFLLVKAGKPGTALLSVVIRLPSFAKNTPTLEQESLPIPRPATVCSYVQQDEEMIYEVIERPCLAVYSSFLQLEFRVNRLRFLVN